MKCTEDVCENIVRETEVFSFFSWFFVKDFPILFWSSLKNNFLCNGLISFFFPWFLVFVQLVLPVVFVHHRSFKQFEHAVNLIGLSWNKKILPKYFHLHLPLNTLDLFLDSFSDNLYSSLILFQCLFSVGKYLIFASS